MRRLLTCAVPGDDRDNFIGASLEAEEEMARWWNEINVLGRLLSQRGRLKDAELSPLWRDLRNHASERRRRPAN